MAATLICLLGFKTLHLVTQAKRAEANVTGIIVSVAASKGSH